MDREPEELQFLGVFGICRESFKITAAWRKIFSIISLSLILPLSSIYLAQIQISDAILAKIGDIQEGQEAHILSEWFAFGVFKAIYLLFLLIFSLPSISAVVYTIACIYSSKDLTFKTVISVVPKVWKRLMITFSWNFLILLIYNFVTVSVIALLTAVYCVLSELLSVHIDADSTVAIVVVRMIIFTPYLIGVMYITLVWFLASVITILEDIRGIEAIKKGKNLIKGKRWISWRICAMFLVCSKFIHVGFRNQVLHGDSSAMAVRVSLGILYLLLLVVVTHFGLVSQTIVYFVCKSYHKENIDKSSLAGHLDGYYIEYYVPLREDEDPQLGGNSV